MVTSNYLHRQASGSDRGEEEQSESGQRPKAPFRLMGIWPLDLKSLLFAGFLTAGTFKAATWFSNLPFDLTIMFGVLSTVLAFIALVRDGLRIAYSLLWVLGLFLLFTLSIPHSPFTAYSTDKIIRLFTLTFLAMALPPLLFKTREDLLRLISAVALIGFLLTLAGLSTLLGGQDVQRLSVANSTTIALGRMAGFATIWIVCLRLEHKLGSIVTLTLITMMSVVVLASGSRGPLLSLPVVLIATGLIFYAKGLTSIVRLVASLIIVALVLWITLPFMPSWSMDRINTFFRGEWGDSEQVRSDAMARSFEIIAHKPLGIGWGGYDAITKPVPERDLVYVHNIVTEVFLEGGWPAGVAFSCLLLLALYKSYAVGQRLQLPEARALFAVLLFCVLNAQVSGEVNNERELFAFIALGLSLRSARSHNGGKTMFDRSPILQIQKSVSKNIPAPIRQIA